jgi:hypothetical protein
MINNAALDVAIGLILMYLMLSLLCTVVNELIATYVLNLRAKSLAAAMPEVLDDPDIRKAFYDHGLIASTKAVLAKAAPLQPSVKPAAPSASQPSQPEVAERKAGDFAAATAAATAPAKTDVAPAIAHPDNMKSENHPAYISAETFVQTLIGCLAGTRLPAGADVPSFKEIEQAIQNLPPSNLKSALLSSLITADHKIEAFRTSVATWFDDSMDRLSGAYKRNLKFISIMIGMLVAVAFNADTLGVAGALWQDPALRAQVVEQATAVVSKDEKSACSVAIPKSGNQTDPVTLDAMKKAIATTEDCLRPFPIGWTSGNRANWTVMSIIGWIITGLALSLGAPFWFDLLSKFVNIRGGGPKPKRADNK